LRERYDVLWVPAPVCVGALHGDLALYDVAGEELSQLRGEVGANPHRDGVEVDEECGVGRVVELSGGRRRLGAAMDRCNGYARNRVGGAQRRPLCTRVHELPGITVCSSATMRSSSLRFTFPLPVMGKASRKRTRSGVL